MKTLRDFLVRSFFWTYSRGSWQWDICCLVFLCIIFTTPRDFLMSYTHRPLTPDQIESIVKSFLGSLL